MVRGDLKVMNAYAVAADGTPIGLLGQKWWRREARAKRSDCKDRTVDEKETRYWLSAIRGSELSLSAAGTRAWFQLDREGDRYATLKALNETGQWFTVRSTYGHRFLAGAPRTRRLRHAVAASKVRRWFQLDVPARFDRPGRRAMMAVRTTSVVLEMLEPSTGERYSLPVNVVDAREVGTVPCGAKPVHWRLLTNRTVVTDADVAIVLRGYAQRWKIEELHRTWKSGACRVERRRESAPNRERRYEVGHHHGRSSYAPNSSDFRCRQRIYQVGDRSNPADEAQISKKSGSATCSVPIDWRGCPLARRIRWLHRQVFRRPLRASPSRPNCRALSSITIRRGLDLIAPVALALQQLEAENKTR